MNGPWHYTEAEGLLERAMTKGASMTALKQQATFEAAQIHATLALAAATIDAARNDGEILYDWTKATR